VYRDGFLDPAVGNKIIGCRVLVTNYTSGAVSVSPMDFRYVSEAGAVYSASLLPSDYALGYCDLLPGGQASGTLLFEIPRSNRRGTLRFAPLDPFRGYTIVMQSGTGKRAVY